MPRKPESLADTGRSSSSSSKLPKLGKWSNNELENAKSGMMAPF